jgi:hypothetical protein
VGSQACQPQLFEQDRQRRLHRLRYNDAESAMEPT